MLFIYFLLLFSKRCSIKRVYKNNTNDNLIVEVDNDFHEWQYLSNILPLTLEFSKILESYKWIIYRNFTDMPFYISDNPPHSSDSKCET